MTNFIIIIDRAIHHTAAAAPVVVVDMECQVVMDHNVKMKIEIGTINQMTAIDTHMKIGIHFFSLLSFGNLKILYFLNVMSNCFFSYYQQQNRNDYRPGGGYDRNDYRQNYQDYRGNGYDNRDPAYFNAMRMNGGAGASGGNRGYGNRDGSYESYYDGNEIHTSILEREKKIK